MRTYSAGTRNRRAPGVRPSALPGALGEFVSEVGRRYGPSPALVIKPAFRTRATTYQQLDEAARRVGRYLQGRGIGKGDRILICAPNMPEWVEVFFGCHKIGAVAVPLDVRSAPSFVGSVARATEPRLGILSRPTARLADAVDTPCIALEQLEAELPGEKGLLEDVSVAPDDIAEIMFTSGTTGDPKGVILTHGNILSNVQGVSQILAIKPSFRLLSLLPLSHMLEQTVGLLAPLSGGCRVIYPVSRQPSILFRAMSEYHVTMLVAVPQALQLFLNAIEREAQRQGTEATLHRLLALARRVPRPVRRALFRSVHARLGGKLALVVSGGAYLDPQLARKWELMGVEILQGYGATEAAPIISCDRPARRRPGAVGQPFPDVEVRIHDDGEILARGPNIFQGYWRNPTATAQSLQDGWYHTGDLGYLAEGQFLHLRGRKKDLIVLANGQNVYPEDIEAELARHPAVADGVVVGLECPGGAVEVHAVLLMRDGAQAADAVRWANQRLADHQRIQGFTAWPLEDFPRTHTLKVKKQEVLDYLRKLEGGRAAVAPQPEARELENPLHRLIAEIASAPPAHIRPESTLGELNLDSLGRVELLSVIEQDLGASIDETAVSPGTTLAELEGLVAAGRGQRREQSFVTWPLSPIGCVAREGFLQGLIFPLYHALWRVHVVGRERLAGVAGPVMVASNHHFAVGKYGADPAAVWMALPRSLRLGICTAGEEHAVFDPKVGGFVARLCNAFPLSKQGNVRGSLEYIGRLLDLGWSVLIFPEGNLFDGGPLQPFMGGTGLMALEGGTSVVPVWIDVERRCILQKKGWPWRGAFSVYLGDPLIFAPGTSYAEATDRIETAVRALGDEAARAAAPR